MKMRRDYSLLNAAYCLSVSCGCEQVVHHLFYAIILLTAMVLESHSLYGETLLSAILARV